MGHVPRSMRPLAAARLLVLPALLAFACGGGSSDVGGSTSGGSGGASSGGASSGGGSSSSSGGASSSSGASSSGSADGGNGDGATTDAAPCSGCARDWGKFPPVANVAAASELWVLSDIHGDYAAFTKLLLAAKLIAAAPAAPAAVKWTGGTAYVVVVGDLIDKGPDAVDVVRLASALSIAAASVGGGVVVTMGNHEAEFLADPLNSKAAGKDGIDPQLVSLGLTPQATAAGQNDVGAFIRGLPIAAKVGSWFFVHGGKTGGKSVAQLSMDLVTGIDGAGFGAPVLSATDSLLEARLSGAGPQWWDATGNPTALLTTWTQALGVSHLVMGHQPGSVGFADGSTRGADQMAQKYGGLLFLVDTGLSVGADATGGAWLHVTKPGAPGEAFEEVLPTGATRAL